jgi:hypothetical protein
MTYEQASEKAIEQMQKDGIDCNTCKMYEDCSFYKTCLVKGEYIADILRNTGDQ